MGPCPKSVKFTCCAQFAVSRSRIQGRPLDFYTKALEYVADNALWPTNMANKRYVCPSHRPDSGCTCRPDCLRPSDLPQTAMHVGCYCGSQGLDRPVLLVCSPADHYRGPRRMLWCSGGALHPCTAELLALASAINPKPLNPRRCHLACLPRGRWAHYAELLASPGMPKPASRSPDQGLI